MLATDACRLLLLCCMGVALHGAAQNLVLNPGFEQLEKLTPPVRLCQQLRLGDDFTRALAHWSSFSDHTPDFIRWDSTLQNCPYPTPREGRHYAGIVPRKTPATTSTTTSISKAPSTSRWCQATTTASPSGYILTNPAGSASAPYSKLMCRPGSLSWATSAKQRSPPFTAPWLFRSGPQWTLPAAKPLFTTPSALATYRMY